ncbi:MAG: zinc ribbon domain-containing protein [Candidatus Saccharibacteria bacterium]
MPEEQQCPNCQQPIENGAIYCGNCGFKLDTSATAQQVNSNSISSNQAQEAAIPAYDIPTTHHRQHWAAMALAFGVIAIGGGALVPLLGIVFGITGVVMSTSSYRKTHGWLKPVSLIVPVLALLLSIGFWVNNSANNAKQTASNSAGTSNGISSMSVTTPCYTLTFKTEFNVNNASGSCTINAYNESNFVDSSNIYKVLASQTNQITTANFDSTAKQAIESDVSKNLPGFNITNQSSNIFSGSPAYYIQAYNSSTNVAVIEETILHNDPSARDNFFTIVHAVNDSAVNLDELESTWHWNN